MRKNVFPMQVEDVEDFKNQTEGTGPEIDTGIFARALHGLSSRSKVTFSVGDKECVARLNKYGKIEIVCSKTLKPIISSDDLHHALVESLVKGA